MRIKTRQALLIAALILYSLLVFVLDVVAPVGVEVWVLNLPVILVSVLFRNKRMAVFAALACSGMVALGSVLSPPGSNPHSWDFMNRGMGLATMWLIAGMAIAIVRNSNRLDDAVNNLRSEMARHLQTSRSLEKAQERLRLAVEAVGMGTVDVNFTTETAFWSATYLRMLGYETDLDGETPVDTWLSHVHPDDEPRIQEARKQALRNRSLYSEEFRIKRADNGAIVWLAAFGRYYYNEAGQAVRFLGVTFDITRRKELECQLTEITARTQRSIGQELHDGVGQEITGLGLIAKTLSQRLSEAGSEHRLATRLVAGLNQLHENVRALARGLVPVEIEEKGLWAALDDLASRTSEQSGINVLFECPECVEMPDHAISMELYRIAQEAVSNALRHGRPQNIHLTLLPQPNGLRLRIQDDGVGISDQPTARKGLGLRIMEYRASLMGGEFRVKPAKGGGTVVTVSLPRRKADVSEENGKATRTD